MFDLERKNEQSVRFGGHFSHFEILVQIVLLFVDVIQRYVGAAPDFPGEIVDSEYKAQLAVTKTYLKPLNHNYFYLLNFQIKLTTAFLLKIDDALVNGFEVLT